MLDQLREMFAYNQWANQRLLDACAPLTVEDFTRPMGSSFSSLRDTLAHIYGAEWIWFERWQRHPTGLLPAAGEFPDLGALRARWASLENARRAYLQGLAPQELAREISYRNQRGEMWSYTLLRMLHHVLLHSAYHRGQVTTLLRQLGAKSRTTDFLAHFDDLAGKLED